MYKEQITDKEAICLLIFFLMGSTLIIGIGGEAKNDAWISGIISIIMSIPIIYIYSRILSLFPGRDLFDILIAAFGNTLGKIAGALYVWYAFHLGAIVFRNVGEFLNIVAIPETPMLFTLLYVGLVCIFAAKSGIEVMARVGAYTLPIILAILAIVLVLVIPLFRFNYLKPILGEGIGPVLKGGFSGFSFPFAESVLFTGVFYALKTKKAPYKAYFSGIIITGAIIVILTLRNVLVLGDLLGSLYFPSYTAVSMISVSDFVERIEVTVAIVFVTSTLVKAAVCLFVSCKGIAKIFNLSDYRSVVLQVGLLMIYFSCILYDNIMEMKYWAFKVYPYYAFPFQVIIPIILLIFAEIRSKKTKKN